MAAAPPELPERCVRLHGLDRTRLVCDDNLHLVAPIGQAPCPSCGSLIWFPAPKTAALPANGELIPAGGGAGISLARKVLTIGRRETCDIPLRFPNISGLHAELSFRNGYWYIRDKGSTNGLKVNGVRVMEKLLHPNDRVTIGKRDYTIRYELPVDHRGALEEAQEEDIMGQSLLEKAGLAKPKEDKHRRGFDPGDFLLGDDE